MEELLSEAEIAARVDALADRLAPRVDQETVAVCLLTGGLWFAADLMRALYRRGCDVKFDALWLASYGDAASSSGTVDVRAGLQRSVEGRQVLVLDDVFDSGRSLAAAKSLLQAAGARTVLTCVFARKPWPTQRAVACDFAAWEAPARFLAGYGMDAAGAHRGRPSIVALD
jgi:hypoxanthine phosphoribosyltransferase